jgi:predicted adenylyl cyclase CyaB
MTDCFCVFPNALHILFKIFFIIHYVARQNRKFFRNKDKYYPMATNIEIKAWVADPESLRERVESLSDTAGELITQEDTFFHTPSGRLKLRVIAPDYGQLIYYERNDEAGPKRSDYLISVTSEPETLKAALSAALGIRGRVRKERWLYWIGHTRVHLDQVEGLGSFMELEVVLQPGQSAEEGQMVAEILMQELGLKETDLIEGAYIDLLGE